MTERKSKRIQRTPGPVLTTARADARGDRAMANVALP
jgi:hypothetical protein